MLRGLKNKVGKKGSSGEGIVCSNCGSNHIGVIDTTYHVDTIRRRRKCLNCEYRFVTLEMTLENTPDHVGSQMAISLRHLSGVLARTQHIVAEQLGKIDATVTASSPGTASHGRGEAHSRQRAGVASVVQATDMDG